MTATQQRGGHFRKKNMRQKKKVFLQTALLLSLSLVLSGCGFFSGGDPAGSSAETALKEVCADIESGDTLYASLERGVYEEGEFRGSATSEFKTSETAICLRDFAHEGGARLSLGVNKKTGNVAVYYIMAEGTLYEYTPDGQNYTRRALPTDGDGRAQIRALVKERDPAAIFSSLRFFPDADGAGVPFKQLFASFFRDEKTGRYTAEMPAELDGEKKQAILRLESLGWKEDLFSLTVLTSPRAIGEGEMASTQYDALKFVFRPAASVSIP